LLSRFNLSLKALSDDGVHQAPCGDEPQCIFGVGSSHAADAVQLVADAPDGIYSPVLPKSI